MGSVWSAYDLNLGSEVAVKTINPAFANSSEALGRFKREARAAAAIRSTYVVQILDYGVDGETPYIAMELLKGESLADRLKRVKRLSAESTAVMLGQVGRALALAHAHGIVHRDMKPENVFLVSEGTEDIAKVLDFGIARLETASCDENLVRTSTGTILGTPYYMSPEQAAGQPVDHRSDIWSFGAIAFQCLVGSRPFGGKSLGELFHAICMAPLPTPSAQGSVPDGFDAWFARAVERNRSERFQTIEEASDALRALCGRNAGHTQSMRRGSLGENAAPVAAPVSAKASCLQETAPPASRTLSDRERPRRKVVFGITAALAALAACLWGAYRLKPEATSPVPNFDTSSIGDEQLLATALTQSAGSGPTSSDSGGAHMEVVAAPSAAPAVPNVAAMAEHPRSTGSNTQRTLPAPRVKLQSKRIDGRSAVPTSGVTTRTDDDNVAGI